MRLICNVNLYHSFTAPPTPEINKHIFTPTKKQVFIWFEQSTSTYTFVWAAITVYVRRPLLIIESLTRHSHRLACWGSTAGGYSHNKLVLCTHLARQWFIWLSQAISILKRNQNKRNWSHKPLQCAQIIGGDLSHHCAEAVDISVLAYHRLCSQDLWVLCRLFGIVTGIC